MTDRSLPFRLSEKARRTQPPPINFLLSLPLANPGLISLAAGLVDQETLPAEEMRALTAKVLADPGGARQSLQYGETAGLGELRQAIVEHVCRLDGVTAGDLKVSADSVVLSSGSQQLLYIVTDMLCDPGDIVITEWPSYFVYTGVLNSLGVSVRAVDMDEGGMKIDALAETLAQLKADGELNRLKIVYTCDYYQNPTGITLDEDRRQPLLELVRSYCTGHRICILEDAAYRELSASAAAPRSIKSYEDDNALVVLAQTFSKPFSPGLRTGYALLPDALVGPALDQKGGHDFGSCNFVQHVLLEAMRSGRYDRHVVLLRRRYRAKRDAMLAALDRHLGDFECDRTSWTVPGGGLYVYLTLPEWMDTGADGELFASAVAEGVAYVPGEYCYGPDPRRQTPRHHMRLTFGTVDESAIDEGIARLSRAIRKAARPVSAATAPPAAGVQRPS